ncbi:hypothetical protein [Trinickia sp.]|uniref:hypothetical protein n=1 Tax=Trinickia sp. TaxID=2571163 RepID=UPI003F7F7F5B
MTYLRLDRFSDRFLYGNARGDGLASGARCVCSVPGMRADCYPYGTNEFQISVFIREDPKPTLPSPAAHNRVRSSL